MADYSDNSEPADDELAPASPEDLDVENEEPRIMQLEGARVLAADAMERLSRAGFDEEEVIDWATTFIAEQGSGDVDTFIDWIEAKERLDGEVGGGQ